MTGAASGCRVMLDISNTDYHADPAI